MECWAITHSALVVFFVSSLLIVSPVSASVEPECKVWGDPPGNLTFTPADLGILTEGTLHELLVEIPQCHSNDSVLTFTVADERVANIAQVVQLPPDEQANRSCWTYRVDISGNRLGFTPIEFLLERIPGNHTSQGHDESIPDTHVGRQDVIVMRPKRVIDVIFRLLLAGFIIILNLGFGCALDLGIVKTILRRPIPPIIGFCCQFCCMPLLGLLVSKTLRMDNIFAFGLLTLSCCPGGGGSNVWCLLLHGDVNLSLTMTFVSLVACLAMMPFWLFTLSRFYVDPSQVKIPFTDILVTLACFVIPCMIGIGIRKWRQSVGDRLAALIKPLSIVFVIFVMTFTIYVNKYIYVLIGQMPSLVPPAMMLPWCGFIIGYSAGRLLGQPHYRALTIAIETGIQNFGIALVLLQQSFPQPFGNLAATMPLITAHFTPLPLYLAFMFFLVRDKLYKPFMERRRAAAAGPDDEKLAIEDADDNAGDGVEVKIPPSNHGNGTMNIQTKDPELFSFLLSLDARESVL